MLDQLIYTRCSPYRDLKNNGRVVLNSDGYGVFSMSSELFSSKWISNNYDFLKTQLARQNGAKETSEMGLFDSYEYFMVAPNVYAISYEVARPHCKIPRANGQGHRPETHIKQSFFGNIEGYPTEWFGSSIWDAHHKSENDYYLNNDATPNLLPQVSSKPINGYINTSLVKKFVNDGRVNAVKSGIWFLLQEFEKSEEDRKVLLIKDIPENVELWITAIEYGFSASMAQKITFTTNRSKLGGQNDSILFYYTDDTGRFYHMMNHSIPQTRRPYCMIVGYHPKDNFCSALRQMTTSNFVIIDGTTKTISFQPDDTINMPYYSAVVQYDADIQDFCNDVLPSLAIYELTGDLPQLFDAYKYLLDSNHKSSKWEYTNTVRHFNTFLKYGIPKNLALNNYLIEECLTVYCGFGTLDEMNGYPLMKHMYNLAKVTNKKRDIIGCLADIISDKLNSLTERNNNIVDTWQMLKTSDLVLVVQPAFRDLFNDTELLGYAKQFKNSDSASVETVLDMFFYMLSKEKIGLNTISETNEKYSFVCRAIFTLRNDRNRLLGILKKLNTDPDLFINISLSVAQHLEKHDPSKTADWWDTIADICGDSILELYKKLCASKFATIEMVEKLLANRLENVQKFDPNLGRIFSEAIAKLGKNPDTGKLLFGTWVKISQPNDFLNIIQTIKKYNLNPQVEKEIFHLTDSKLPYDTPKNVNPEVFRKLNQWANSLNIVSKSVSFYEFKRNFEIEREVENAVNLVYNLLEKKLTVDKKFFASNYFIDIVAVAAKFCNADLHIALLCLSQGANVTTMNQYVDEYVKNIMYATKNRNMVSQLMSLCEATMCKSSGKIAAFTTDVQHSLYISFEKYLVQYYKPAFAEQISKCEDCDQNVQEKLISMLEDANEKVIPKGLGGLFNNLFGKK